MPATLQTLQITEGFRNFPQKTKRNVSSITGLRTSKYDENDYYRDFEEFRSALGIPDERSFS